MTQVQILEKGNEILRAFRSTSAEFGGEFVLLAHSIASSSVDICRFISTSDADVFLLDAALIGDLESLPPRRWVVLYGPRDFDLLLQGMKAGISDYIPMNQAADGTRNALQQYLLRQARPDEHYAEPSAGALQRKLEKVNHTRFFEAAFVKPGGERILKLPEVLETEFGIRFPGKHFCVMEFYMDSALGHADTEQDGLYQSHLISEVRNLTRTFAREIVFYYQKRTVFIILNYDGTENIGNLCRAILLRLQSILKQSGVSGQFNIVYSRIYDDVRALLDAVEQVRNGSDVRLVYGYGRVVNCEELPEELFEEPELEAHIAEALAQAVLMLDSQRCELLIRQILYVGISGHQCSRLVKSAIDVMINALNSVSPDFVVSGDYQELSSHTPPLPVNMDSVEEIRSETVRWITEMIQAIQAAQQPLVTPAIRSAIYYIGVNFAKPLSLEEVAGYVNLQPAYFSTKFRQQIGKSFTQYLAGCRVEEAKRMLRTTNFRIQEVGAAVGMENSRYFSQIFAKYTGMTPSQYRVLHQEPNAK